MVCLQSTDIGTRICLAAEGFGNRRCFLENIADKNIPSEVSTCVFVIEQALSVRALQEMITVKQQDQQQKQQQQQQSSSTQGSQKESKDSKEQNKETSTGGGSRTLLYGHAVLLRHGYSKMYLACLSSTSSSSGRYFIFIIFNIKLYLLL